MSTSFIKSTHKVLLPAAASAQSIQDVCAVTLHNGIQIVVFVDNSTKMSFAAASVNVGSNLDPIELPGLAHLCEHMLFLGTARDPHEGGFDKYLSENAGYSNAWTDDGTTNYHFQCSNGAFSEALTRFSHFFVEPTMTPSALEREVQAVHSEDEKNHTTDYWCQQEMIKERLVDTNHPYSRYGNGNATTLWDGPRERGIDVHAFLMQFYHEHYVAENLVLVVYSPLPAQQIIHGVLEPILRNVRTRTHAPRNVQSFAHLAPDGLIAKSALATWTNMKAHCHVQKLHISFPFRTTKQLSSKFKTFTFVTWLVGHECRGSIVDVLRREVLCTGLSTDETAVDDENWIMTISVSLTTKGLRRLDFVIDLIFAGIQFLQKKHRKELASVTSTQQGGRGEGGQGKMSAIFQEMTSCDRLQFHSQEVPADLDEFTATLAQNCNTHGPERCWCGNELVSKMNKEKIQEALDLVALPQNSYFVLEINDPDRVVKDSEYCVEHPEILAEIEKREQEESTAAVMEEEEMMMKKRKSANFDHEDDDDEEEEEEFDEDDEEGEEDDEEWFDVEDEEEDDDEGEKCEGDGEAHHHHEHHHHEHHPHQIKKVLPIESLRACRSLATETTTFHKAKHSKPTKIDEALLAHWSRDRSKEELLQCGFKLPSKNPFICCVPEVQEDAVDDEAPHDEHEQEKNHEDIPPRPQYDENNRNNGNSNDNDTNTNSAEKQQQQDKKENEEGAEYSIVDPQTLHNSEWGRVLFQEYKTKSTSTSAVLQRGYVVISLESPFAYSCAKNRFFTRTLSSLLDFSMAELVYFAELGALHIDTDATFRGLNFVVEGPQEKLFVLVRCLVRDVFGEIFGVVPPQAGASSSSGASCATPTSPIGGDDIDVSQDRVITNPEKYRACADRILRKILSVDIDAPNDQAYEWSLQYRYATRYHHRLDILQELGSAVPPFEEFLDFVKNILFAQRFRYDILVVASSASSGALLSVQQEALNFGAEFMEKEIILNHISAASCVQNKIVRLVPAQLSDFPPGDVILNTPSRAELRRNKTSNDETKKSKAAKAASAPALADASSSPFGTLLSHTSTTAALQQDPNSACIVSFYLGKSSPLTLAMSEVISSLLEPHYYSCLRTQETLGYIVYCTSGSTDGHRFIRFVAQSAEESAWYLFCRTFAFLRAAASQIFLLKGDDDHDEGKNHVGNNRDKKRDVAAGSGVSVASSSSSSPSAPQRRERSGGNSSDENGKKNELVQRQKLHESIRVSAASHAAECRDKPKNISELGEQVWNLRYHPSGYHVAADEAKILDDESQINVDTVSEYFRKHLMDRDEARVMVSLVHGLNDKDGETKLEMPSSSSSSTTTTTTMPNGQPKQSGNIFKSFKLGVLSKRAGAVSSQSSSKSKSANDETAGDGEFTLELEDFRVPPTTNQNRKVVGIRNKSKNNSNKVSSSASMEVEMMVVTTDREAYKKFCKGVKV